MLPQGMSKPLSYCPWQIEIIGSDIQVNLYHDSSKHISLCPQKLIIKSDISLCQDINYLSICKKNEGSFSAKDG